MSSEFVDNEKVKTELKSIEAEIKRLEGRRKLLLQMRNIADILASENGDTICLVEAKSVHKNGNRSGLRDIDLLEELLSQQGPLSVAVIIRRFAESGWTAGEDHRRAWDRIDKLLKRHPEIFKRQSRGYWDVLPERKAKNLASLTS